MRLINKLVTNLIFLILLISISPSAYGGFTYVVLNDESNFNQIQWSSMSVLSTESTGDSNPPASVADSKNNLHLVWSDLTDYNGAGTDLDIFYKKYDSSTQSWSNVITISTDSTSSSLIPLIAVDSKDNLYVVWADNTDYNGAGIDTDLFYKKYDVTSQTWSNTVVISTESTGLSFRHSIAIDSKDNLHVVWYDNTDYNGAGTDYDIIYKKFDSTTQSWGTIVVISMESTEDSYSPTIAIDSKDNLHVAWYDFTDYNGAGSADDDIFYKKYDATSQSWGTTVVVSIESTGSSSFPSIAIDSKDNLHVVWSDLTDYNGAGTDLDIFYKIFNSGLQVWTSPIIASTESSDSSTYPSIAIDKYDNLYTVWIDITDYNGAGTDSDIFYKNYNSALQEWTTSIVISTTSSSSLSPSVVVDKNYNISVFWSDNADYNGAGTDYDIFYVTGNIVPETPLLNRVSSVNNQKVELNWNDVSFVNQYDVYRSNELIYNTTNLSPIANINTTSYNETLNSSGVYFYAIAAANSASNSEISNNIYVEVNLKVSNNQTNIQTITKNQTITQSDDLLSHIASLPDNDLFVPVLLGSILVLVIMILIRKKKK